MSISDLIAIVGSVITIFCAWFSYKQAGNAENYSNALKAAKARMGLLTVAERLRTVQDPIGQLPQTVADLRGSKPNTSIAKIHVEFDRALSSLDKGGPSAVGRASLQRAQTNLHSYEDSVRQVIARTPGSQLDIVAMRSVRTSIQDAIVEIVGAAERLEDQ